MVINFDLSVPTRIYMYTLVCVFCVYFCIGSCGGEISIDFRSSATIRSPNYPSNYLENVRCSWVITAPQNSRVRLSFSDFETESLYDTVELCSSRCCDGSSVLASLSGRLATSARLYQSTSNVLSVELTTDGRVASTGFRATVSAIEVEVPPTGRLCALFCTTELWDRLKFARIWVLLYRTHCHLMGYSHAQRYNILCVSLVALFCFLRFPTDYSSNDLGTRHYQPHHCRRDLPHPSASSPSSTHAEHLHDTAGHPLRGGGATQPGYRDHTRKPPQGETG